MFVERFDTKVLALVFRSLVALLASIYLTGCGDLKLTLPEDLSSLLPQSPEVKIIMPANSSFIGAASVASVTISGTCTENGRPVSITGAVTVTASCSNNTFSTIANLSALTDGGLTLFADHSTEKGVAAPQATRSFIKDVVGPNAVTFSDPSTNLIVGSTNYTFTWSTTDVGLAGLRSGTTYQVEQFDNGTCAGTPVATTSVATASFNYSSLVDTNIYSVRLKAYDNADNASVASCSSSITIDTSAPTLAISDPTTSSTSYARQVAVNVSVGNDGTAAKWCLSETQTSAPASGSANCNGGGGASSGWYTTRPTSINLTAANASKTVHIWIADSGDVVNAANVFDTITLDTVLPATPTVALTDPNTSSTTNTNQATVNLSITSDTDAVAWCVIEQANAAAAPSAPTFNSCSTTWATTRPTTQALGATGVRKIYVYTKDVAGNISGAAATATIDYSTTAPANPTLALSDATTSSTSHVRQVATAVSIGNDASAVKWCLSQTQNTAPASGIATCSGTGWVTTEPTTFNVSSGDGGKTVYVWIADAYNNVNGTTVSDSITLDTVLPANPTVALTDPNSSSTTNTNQATVNLSVTSDTDAVAWCVIEQANAAAAPSAPTFNSCSTTWATTRPTTQALGATGVRKIYVYTKDVAENISSTAATASIDYSTTAPANPTLALSDATTSSTSHVRQIATAVSIGNDTTAAKWCLSEIQTTAPATGSSVCLGTGWVTTEPTTFNVSNGDGAKTVYVWIADIYNNVNASAVTDAITLDTVLPATPTVALTDPNTSSTTNTNQATVNLSITSDTDAVAWCVIEQATATAAPSAPTYNSCSTTWATTRPTTQALGATGVRKIYVYTKDVAGNISGAAATATIDYATTAPANPTLSLSDATTSSTSYIRQVASAVAIGNDGTAAKWCLSETQSTAPASGTAACSGSGWLTTEPTTFNVSSGDGARTVYVWIADAYNNVNGSAVSDAITLDTTLPATPAVWLSDPNSSSKTATNQSTVTLSILGDTDAVAWCVIEQATATAAPSAPTYNSCSTTWVTTRPTTQVLGATGSRKVYVYTKDVASNVSLAAGRELDSTWVNVTNLAAYYKFNESNTDDTATVADSSGNGLSGTLTTVEGAAVYKNASGKLNGGMVLDGTDDEFRMGDVLDMPTNDFSIAFWIKSTDSRATNFPIVSKGFDLGGGSPKYVILFEAGIIGARIYDGTNNINVDEAPTLVNDGSFHHVVAVVRRSPTDRVSFYIDGVDQGVSHDISTVGNIDNIYDFTIGSTHAATTNFAGTLDDISVWSRALSANEISEIYQKQAGNAAAASIDYATTVPANPTLSLSDGTTSSTTYIRQVATAVAIGNDATAVKWCLSESQSTAPVSGSAACSGTGWLTTKPTTFNVSSGDGNKTVYVWVANAYNTVNGSAISDSIVLDTGVPSLASSLALYDPSSSPGNLTTPTITVGGVNVGDVVKIYTDGSCLAPGLRGSATSTGTSVNVTSNALTAASYTFNAEIIDSAGNSSGCSTQTVSYVLDTSSPTVTVNQKAGQSDPSGTLPILFTVTFSESVTGFTASDVTIGGTATVTGKSISGSGANYEISIDTASDGGTIIASIGAGAAQDSAGNTSQASTSTDNTVTYSYTAIAAFSITGITGSTDTTVDSWLNVGPNPTVNWQNTTGEDSYDVTIYEYDGTTVKCATANSGVNTTSYNFSSCSLTDSTMYRAKVVAKNSSTTRAASNDLFLFTYKEQTIIGPIQISGTANDGKIDGSGLAVGANFSDTVVAAGEDGSWQYKYAFLRFALPQSIPSTMEITNAYLELYKTGATNWNTGTDYLVVRTQFSSNALQATDAFYYPQGYNGTTLLAQEVRWPASGGLNLSDNAWAATPNLKTPVQYLVTNYNGLSSGAFLQFWIAQKTGDGNVKYVSFNDYSTSAANAAKLTIESKHTSPLAFAITGLTGGSDTNPDNILASGTTPTLNWQNTLGEVSFDVTIYEDDGTTVKCATANVAADSTSHTFGCTLNAANFYKASVVAKDSSGNTTAASNNLFRFGLGIKVIPMFADSSGNNMWYNLIRKQNSSGLHKQENLPCNYATDAGQLFEHCFLGSTIFKMATLESSCSGLTASDALGAFDWVCDASSGTAVFYTTGLKSTMGLKDLLNSTSWKSNQVTVMNGGSQVAQSTSSVWFNNTVVAAPANTSSSDARIILDDVDDDGGGPDQAYAQDTIFTVDTTRATSGYALGYRVNFAVLTGAKLTYSGNTSNNCGGLGVSSLDNRCMLATTSWESWVEGEFDGEGGATDATIGIYMGESYASVINQATVRNVNGTGIYLSQYAQRSALMNSFVTDSITDGVYGRGSAQEMMIENVTATANHSTGINLGGTCTRPYLLKNTSTYWNWAMNVLSGCGWVLVDGGNIWGSGIGLYLGNYTVVRNARISGNGSYGIFSEAHGWSQIYNSVITNNNGYGIYNTAWNLVISKVLIANNENVGIANSGSNLTVNNATIVMNDGGINSSGSNGAYSQIALIGGEAVPGIAMTGNNNTFANILSHHFSDGINLTNSSNNFFTSWIISYAGNNCVVSGGTDPGLTSSCTNQGPLSDATYTTSIDVSNTFVGKVTTDDTANSSDTNGSVAYSGLTDWNNFTGFYRFWGLDGTDILDWNARSNCWTGDTCRIWDFSVKTADTVLRNISNDGSTQNAAFTAGSTCPAAVHGNKAISNGVSNYLINAIEIMDWDDGYGNDNGLCESGEKCIYSPNLGFYQGHGSLTSACTFQNGTVSNVLMYSYTTNGN